MIFKRALNLLLIFNFLVSTIGLFGQSFLISSFPKMPMATTNNAVCEGYKGDTAFVFSFGGIDTSLKYSGIHKKCFAFNTVSEQWRSIPDLPDTLGKIAMSANRVGDTIYIIGGYHVFADGSEKSSFKVHRFDVNTMKFVADGEDLPIPTDDQVQCVVNDSLIYVISGWSNTGNIPDVQVYVPRRDIWKSATALPVNPLFSSFGASGCYQPKDSTFYFLGGAYSIGAFPPQRFLRKGKVELNNEIFWSYDDIAQEFYSYRSTCLLWNGTPTWLGGGETTYNYNGRAYANTAIVSTTEKIVIYQGDSLKVALQDSRIPMDLRGLALINGTVYLAGGMLKNSEVSNQLLGITLVGLGQENHTKVNMDLKYLPVENAIIIDGSMNEISGVLNIYDVAGKVLFTSKMNSLQKISLPKLNSGIYIAEFDKQTLKFWIGP